MEHNPYAEAISRESVASSRLALSKARAGRSVVGASKATNRAKQSSSNKDGAATSATTATAVTAATATTALTATNTGTVGANDGLVAAGAEMDATAAVRW